MLFSQPLPIVPLYIPIDRKAAWSGKWIANIGTETVKQMGGPWATRGDACNAILALGTHRLRPGTENNPHFDLIAQAVAPSGLATGRSGEAALLASHAEATRKFFAKNASRRRH